MIETRYLNETSKINENTSLVLKHIKEIALKKGIKEILIPTTSGKTALAAVEEFKGTDLNLLIVTHQTGFRERGVQEVPQETLKKIEETSDVLICQHALAGVGRAVRLQLKTWEFAELAAMVLRTFGQGTKVCAEITMMAADAGKITMKKDIIAAGGSSHGLDTAWIIHPVHSHEFFDLKFKQLIYKPVNF